MFNWDNYEKEINFRISQYANGKKMSSKIYKETYQTIFEFLYEASKNEMRENYKYIGLTLAGSCFLAMYYNLEQAKKKENNEKQEIIEIVKDAIKEASFKLDKIIVNSKVLDSYFKLFTIVIPSALMKIWEENNTGEKIKINKTEIIRQLFENKYYTEVIIYEELFKLEI